MIAFTSICSNYIPKAKILAASLKKYENKLKFILCLTEREINKEAKKFKFFDHIVLSKDLGFRNFERFIFKHSIVEAATSIKGQLFKYLLKKYPYEETFVFFDPDIIILSELKELKEALQNSNIVLVPHLTIPENKDTLLETLDAVKDNELCALKHGVYNLGFLAIKRSYKSNKLIEWWSSRLDMFCYDDIPNGIFVDQRWMDLAPCFFDVLILKHPGYDIAPWNLSMRKVTFKNNKYYSNDKPIRFFHFSGFDSGANEGMIRKYVKEEKNPVFKLRDEYIRLLNYYKQNEIGKLDWEYDFYKSGEKIDPNIRVIYRDNLRLQELIENPFLESNDKIKKKLNSLI